MDDDNRPLKIPKRFKDKMQKLHPYSQMRLLSPFRDLDFPYRDKKAN